MALTVEAAVEEFLSRLTPSDVETDAAKAHRASIEACLRQKLGVTGFFRTGSFGSGTSIRGYSDVDYFALIPDTRVHENSKLTLRNLQETLANRFPMTVIRVRSPAVRVPFGRLRSEATEIVPAQLVRQVGGVPVYAIPDSRGGWMLSSPPAHNDYVAAVDRWSDGRVRPLIRLVKAWKYIRDAPVSSFYLELRAAHHCATVGTMGYSSDLSRFINALESDAFRFLVDPVGIAGYISACPDGRSLYSSVAKVRLVARLAAQAWLAEQRGNDRAAIASWRRLYGERFPAYGRTIR
jgi:hypothetical protein